VGEGGDAGRDDHPVRHDPVAIREGEYELPAGPIDRPHLAAIHHRYEGPLEPPSI
jgi:hypothetical protein